MRRKLLAIALMSTTALTPVQAQAGGVAAFFTALVTAVGGAGATTAATAAAIGGATAAGFAVGTFITSSIGSTLLSIGLSAALNTAFAVELPKPSASMVSFAQPLSYDRFLVGRSRVSGPLGFTGKSKAIGPIPGLSGLFSKDGKRRHYSPVICMHPTRGPVEHWLGDRRVEIDAGGIVGEVGNLGGEHYRIRPFTGQAGQVADAELVARFPEITAAHDFKGLSGAHVWVREPNEKRQGKITPNGRERTWSAVWDGYDQVYDPRDDTFKWTRNAALNIAALATYKWGLDVDWAEVAEQADICDELVPVRGGSSIPRWQLDYLFSDEQPIRDHMTIIQRSCDVFFYERTDGKIGFKVGNWEEPTITLTDEDFMSLQVTLGSAKMTEITEVAVSYVEPNNRWKETTTEPVIINPNGIPNRNVVECYGITEHNQAWRMATRLAATEAAEYVIQAQLTPAGRRIRGHRFVYIEALGRPRFAIEVGQLSIDGPIVTLEGFSVKEADFAKDQSATEPETPIYQEVADQDEVPDMTGLTGVTSRGGAVRFSWDDPNDESLRGVIRSRVVGAADWEQPFTISEQGALSVTATGFLDDEEVEFQGLFRDTNGLESLNWAPIPPGVVQTFNSLIPPAAHETFTVTLAGSDATVEFTYNPFSRTPPESTNIYRADYATGYTGPYDIADAVIVQNVTASPYVDAGLSAGVYAYWGTVVSGADVESDASGPEVVEVV